MKERGSKDWDCEIGHWNRNGFGERILHWLGISDIGTYGVAFAWSVLGSLWMDTRFMWETRMAQKISIAEKSIKTSLVLKFYPCRS